MNAAERGRPRDARGGSVAARAAGRRPFVVTRPAQAGRELTAALGARGADALWLPAFDFGPPPDAGEAERVLARLAQFDLALFVSPAAVRATALALGARRWPAATAIAAVGAGTRAAALATLTFDRDAQPEVVAPQESDDCADGSGSEALWRVLQTRAAGAGLPRRVLLLRAGHGRDWLQARFEQAGAAVSALAVYERRARAWSADEARWVAQRAAGAAPALVLTSSEAVAALGAAATAADASGAALRWLLRGRVLALHPRIVAAAQAAGFAESLCVACDVEALLAAA